MTGTHREHHIGRSIVALLAGIFTGVALTVATDVVLHVVHVFPSWNEPAGDLLLLLATAYRIPFSIAGSYIVARLAPDRPMGHALVSGIIGTLVCTAGAAATWNKGLGAHWYPLALIVLAMPCAWIGGKLRTMQMQDHSTPAYPGLHD